MDVINEQSGLKTRGARWLGWVAVVVAGVFALSLAWRPINSNDIGYHLAYGDRFLDSGRIVDSNDFIYTAIDPLLLDKPGNCPPGAWYDRLEGKYHFPNANYASQIVMSLVHRVCGFTGLCILQVILVGVMLTFMLLSMRRMGLPREWLAVGCLIAAMIGYERFNLRPEMFGYALLTVILFLLSAREIGWRTVAALILTQLAFVQVHSYWVLGLAVATAFWGEAVIRAGWVKFKTGQALEADRASQLKKLSVAGGGMLLAAFVNPWTWRLAIHPIKTMLFLRENNIPTDATSGIHPWAVISEFYRPFHDIVFYTRPTWAYFVVLGLSLIAIMVAIRFKRWGRLAVLAGMIFVSLSMRRNIVPAGLILLPISLATLYDAVRRMKFKPAWFGPPAAIIVLILSVYWTVGVVSGRFYYTERRDWQFGGGTTIRDIPLRMSRLIRSLPRDVRVFTSYNVSSTVLYFSRDERGFRDVPILTNTWAFPAKTVMSRNLNTCSGRPYVNGQPNFKRFTEFAKFYNVGIVVLDCGESSIPLAKFLLTGGNWKQLHFDGKNIIFVRNDVKIPADLRSLPTVDEIIDEIRRSEAFPAFSLNTMAASLYRLGVDELAEKAWRACVEADPDYYEAWDRLGMVLANRKTRRSLVEAKKCFEKSLSIRNDYRTAQKNLDRVKKDISRLSE